MIDQCLAALGVCIQHPLTGTKAEVEKISCVEPLGRFLVSPWEPCGCLHSCPNAWHRIKEKVSMAASGGD